MSMASVALARGINANLLRRWVRETLRLDAAPASMAAPYYVDRPQRSAAGWAMN